MTVLITGKNGQVGGELARLYSSRRDVVMAGRDECDLANPESIRACVRRVNPTVIINPGAYTAVDLAEKETNLCYAVNSIAPRVFAEEAARLNALLVHYSTDYVFDGDKPAAYLESDPVHPMSVYGASKAAGEAAISETGGRYLILRTSWVYRGQGKNFLRTMLRLGAERSELRVVDDQIGAPTSANAIAAATVRLVEDYGAPDATVPSGIYHMTAGGKTSWCGFARAIFSAAALNRTPDVIAIPTSAYPTPAKRPANSVLSNDKFAQAFSFRLPPWQQQLEQVFAEMNAEQSTA